MSLPYMKMYWGDYLGDTAHLTAIQHGGYLLLIAHYWRTGSIPNDAQKLARITRMSVKEWSRHGPTIMEFFPDGKHARIERERDDARLKSEKNRRSAETRWNAGEQPKSLINNDGHDAFALQSQSVGNANQNHNQNQNKKNTPLPPSRGSDGFDLFWEAYPRKVSKGAAAKAWKAAIKKASADEIVGGVKRFKFSDDPQFIPHPATWLNAERWADEAAKPAPYVPTYRPPVFVPPPPDPTMTPEHRERMAAKFDDLLKSLGKSKEM